MVDSLMPFSAFFVIRSSKAQLSSQLWLASSAWPFGSSTLLFGLCFARSCPHAFCVCSRPLERSVSANPAVVRFVVLIFCSACSLPQAVCLAFLSFLRFYATAAAVRLAAFSSLFGLCRACPCGPCNARIRALGWSSPLTSLRNARRYSLGRLVSWFDVRSLVPVVAKVVGGLVGRLVRWSVGYFVQ